MFVRQYHIAQNTVWLTVALVFQKILAFFFFLIIARKLGSVGTGQYVAAFSFSSLFGVFIDLGFSPVITREIARLPERSSIFLQVSIIIKLLLSSLIYPILLGVILLLQYLGAGHPPLELVAITGLIMIVDSLSLTLTSLLRGWHNLFYEAVAVVINKISILIIGVVALIVWANPLAVIVAVLLGSLITLAILISVIFSKISPFEYFSIQGQVLKELVSKAWPFAIATIFSTIYAHLDSILLSIINGSQAVGLYSVAAKTMNAFGFIPTAFSAALFPSLSTDFGRGGTRLEFLVDQALRYLLIISAPLSVGLCLFADFFVSLIGPDYKMAATAVRILMPSLAFMFMAYPFGALLNATNNQYWQTTIIVIGTIFNAGINLLLIPTFSYVGASSAWLFTNVSVLAIEYLVVKKLFDFKFRFFRKSLISVGIAMVGMVLTIYLMPRAQFPILTISLAGTIYLLILYLTREISKADAATLIGIFRKRDNTTISDA